MPKRRKSSARRFQSSPRTNSDAVNTLASTKEGAKRLLKAVEAKTVPAIGPFAAFLVRQLTAFRG